MIIKFLNFIIEYTSPGEQIYNQFVPEDHMVDEVKEYKKEQIKYEKI